MTLRRVVSLFAAAVVAAVFAGFILHLLLAGKPKKVVPVQRKPGERILLCAGDSITAGSYPELLEARLRASRVDGRVLNYGISGYTSREYLHYLRTSGLLTQTDPDVVLLQLGTNDARSDFNHTSTEQFIANMRAIITLITTHRTDRGNPVLLLALVPPVVEQFPSYSKESVRRITDEINPAIGTLAAEYSLFLVDNYTLFARRPEWLDGIHPTEPGYQALADNWFSALTQHGLLRKSIGKK